MAIEEEMKNVAEQRQEARNFKLRFARQNPAKAYSESGEIQNNGVRRRLTGSSSASIGMGNELCASLISLGGRSV